MLRKLSYLIIVLLLVSTISPVILHPVTAQESTLIVAQMKYIKNPNPLKEETWYDWWLNLVTFDRLFRIGPDLEPHPWLCNYYNVSSDGLVWTFKIVNNSYWHDGVKFTVRDIAFTIDFYKKYKPPAWYPNVKYIVKTEVIDDYTIKIYLNVTFVWIKRRFGTMIILPEHIWKYVPEVFKDPVKFNPMSSSDVDKVLAVIKEKAPTDIVVKVSAFVDKYHHLRIGNGPFMLVRWKEGELLEMVKAPKYFKPGFPRADRLIYKVYANPQAQYLAVKTGKVHFMVWTVPYAVIKEIEANPSLVLPKTPDVYIGFIGINMKDPILSNPLVRKAVAHAINKTEIVKVLMLGYAIEAYTYIHPGYKKWVNRNVPKYEFDLKKASELLDKAGLKDIDGDGVRETPDGKDVELTILTPSYDPVRVRIGDLMVEWFKKIGIKLTNKPVDFDTLIDLVYTEHKFQLYIIENDANFEPWYLSSYYVKEQYVPGGNNPWAFINDTFEKLVREMDSTVDENARVKICYKLQEILADQVPLIPLYIRYWMQVYRAEVSGVVDMPGGALNFWTLLNANFKGLSPELPYTKIVPPPTPTPTLTPTPTPAANMTQIINALNSLKSSIEGLKTALSSATSGLSSKIESTSKSITDAVSSLKSSIEALSGLSGYLTAIIILVIINIIISIIAIIRRK